MAQNYPQTPPPAFDPHATPNATYQYPGAAGQHHGIGQPQEQVAGATPPFYGHGGDEQKSYYSTQQLPQQYPPQTIPMQQQQPQQYIQQQYQQGQQFLQVTPIQALSRASAPVDCPICGQRKLTSVQYEIGGTTQFVILPPPLSSLSFLWRATVSDLRYWIVSGLSSPALWLAWGVSLT